MKIQQYSVLVSLNWGLLIRNTDVNYFSSILCETDKACIGKRIDRKELVKSTVKTEQIICQTLGVVKKNNNNVCLKSHGRNENCYSDRNRFQVYIIYDNIIIT